MVDFDVPRLGLTDPPKAKRPHTSFSQIDGWLRCPRKWALKYIEKTEAESTSHYLIFGGAVHRTLARIYAKKMLDDAAMGPEEAQEHFVSDWFNYVREAENVDYGDSGGPDALEAKGLGMIESFALEPLDVQVVGVEKEFRSDLVDERTGEVMDAELLGYIDAIVLDDGELVVHEHKTAAKKWSQTRLANDMQATIYQWATGASRVQFNVLMKTAKPRVDRWVVERSEDEIKEALHVAVSVLKAQKAGIAFPRRDWHCRGCEFRQACDSRGPL